MKFVRDIAKKYKVLVVASIHQPSTTTFELFDKLMLLSRGKVCYNGPVRKVKDYFAGLGYDVST
jgi:ABC-type multidrug transport system ATPase subunit